MSLVVPWLLLALALAGWMAREWMHAAVRKSFAREQEAAQEKADAVRAADEHRRAQLAEDEVTLANEIIRKSGGAALCLALLCFSSVVRAEEPCRREADQVICTKEGFRVLMQKFVDTEHARAVATAEATEARQKQEACAARAAALQRVTEPSPWLWIGSGALGVAAGVALTLLVVQTAR